jgi:UDPglucose--hexose-1-phosphate uridylyltransferase
LTGRWVIMATARQGRPNEFALKGKINTDKELCPFCPGHEDLTTAPVLTIPDPAGRGDQDWLIRAFPNMYPALTGSGLFQEGKSAAECPEAPLFSALPGVGGHEVVVYTPDHECSPGQLAAEQMFRLLRVVRDRALALTKAHAGTAHVLPFCNHGPQAGATLSHPHLQILAAPLVPALIREKLAQLEAHRQENSSCLLCDLLAAEVGKGVRVIHADPSWVVLAPWASRFPYEMQVVPRAHAGRLEDSTDELLGDLAPVLCQVLARLEWLHPDLSYNVVFQSGPVPGSVPGTDLFHWHLEVLPRLARLAGFEAGSGFAINSVKPEHAARQLRRDECNREE